MTSRRALILTFAAAGVAHVLAACEARPIPSSASSAAGNCTRCHGGLETQLGAPPRDLHGNTDPSAVTVGAHTVHLTAPHGIAAPVACEACHAVPTGFPAGGHGDGAVQVSFGALAASDGVTPSWDRVSATCSVYCHGASLSGGAASAPIWTKQDGTQRQCGSCHGFPPLNPHPQRTQWTLADCKTCHPATVGDAGIVAGGAHLDGTTQADFSSMGCTSCHGDAARQPTAENPQLAAAPPIDADGETLPSQRGVGAHLAHLMKASLARPVACTECHVVPTDPAHANDAVDVSFGALATHDGQAPAAWDAQSGSCSSIYCHGATLGGGINTSPSWTGEAREAGCGTCHGVPPPPPHPASSQCNACHPSTVDAQGAIRADAGAHVNGVLDVEKYHPAGWTSQTVHGYAANRGIDACKGCHGAALDGGNVGVSCDTCHAAVTADWRTDCTFCHGDAQRAPTALNPRLPAAPPVGSEGELGTLEPPVGAHQVHLGGGHVAGPISCTECHAVPADISHMTGQAELTWGALAARGTSPSYAGGSCSGVYCHGGTLSGGDTTEPLWTLVDGTQRACGSCHGAPPPGPHPQLTACRTCHALTVLSDAHPDHVVDVAGGRHVDGNLDVTAYHPDLWASPASHGHAANRDFESCQACHGTDFEGGIVNVSCNACHASNGHADWQTDCTFCHGDPARPANRPAPPVGTEGETLTSDRAVGAHEAHLSGARLGRAIACTECHGATLPVNVSHLDGAVALGWGPLATARGAAASFDGASLGCSNYCHGSNIAGGTDKTPVWTGGAAQAACGTCHGAPPPAPHPAAPNGLTDCNGCHDQTVDAAGNLVPGGAHVDGVVQGGHDAEWTNPASATFHAFAANAGLGACETCHGAGLGGSGSAPACTSCHDGTGGAAAWGCTMCHGGEQDATGAPPKAQWGFRTEAMRVGAHRTHVTGSTSAPAFGCAVCHVTPASAFSAGHIEPETTADVAFSGLAVQDLSPAPTWSRAAGTCAVYCHGATLGGGTNKVPSWTGVDQAGCGTCHGTPPPTPHPAAGADLAGCNACHPETVDASGALVPPASGGRHVDGGIQYTRGHELSWMDTGSMGFHAYSANVDLGQCQACHGPTLAGGASGGPCARCHDGAARPAFGSCTMCHGGTLDQTGAPPRATWGNAADAVRTGGHAAHVSPGGVAAAIDCATCHEEPADVFAATHVDGPTAEVALAGLAAFDGAVPLPWARSTPTCASTYCHGETLSGGANTAPLWTGGAAEATCGSCHGAPPPTLRSGGPHPQTTACGGCHSGYGPASANLATHVNGAVDVLPMTCSSCHGDPGRTPTALNPQLAAAPPVDTSGSSDPSRPGVGAHAVHLSGGPLRVALACTECHAVPASTTHADGAAQLAFGPLATGVGTVDGVTVPSYVGGSCAATYCHGSTIAAGGTNHEPSWTSGAAGAACGTCHGAPPPFPHPQTTNCGGCHGDLYGPTTVDPATHVNGALDVGEMTCTSCHGDAARTATPADPRWAAPPVDTHGNATSPQVGAHAIHLDGSPLSSPLACTECHAVPPSFSGHPDGSTTFAWGTLATGAITATRNTNPAFAGFSTTTPSFAGGSCSATYCHGSYSGTYTYEMWDYANDVPIPVTVAYAGNGAAPSFAGGPTTCGSCHGNPPAGNEWHSATHGYDATYRGCDLCHPDATGNNQTGGGTITNPALHVNGVVDLAPQFESRCFGCH